MNIYIFVYSELTFVKIKFDMSHVEERIVRVKYRCYPGETQYRYAIQQQFNIDLNDDWDFSALKQVMLDDTDDTFHEIADESGCTIFVINVIRKLWFPLTVVNMEYIFNHCGNQIRLALILPSIYF